LIAELTAPPFVPKPVGNRPAKKLIVNMEIIEKKEKWLMVLSMSIGHLEEQFLEVLLELELVMK
jgi:hypothetical protein